MASASTIECQACYTCISFEVNRIYQNKCEPCWRNGYVITRCNQCDRMSSKLVAGICIQCDTKNNEPKWKASSYKKCKTCFCASKRTEKYAGNCKKCYESLSNE